MHKPDPTFDEMEKALLRLMPVAVSEEAQHRMDALLEDLSCDSKVTGFDFRRPLRRVVGTGLAAALGFGIFLSLPPGESPTIALGNTPDANSSDLPPELVFLSEADRVEGFSDEGLYVDSGGSAVRKVRVRMIEESHIRDEETGIVVMLSEPREEMYMMPVSTF